MSRSMSINSSAASQAGVLDQPFEMYMDFSGYENSYHSPSLSPAAATKPSLVGPAKIESGPTSLLSANQRLGGPSHQYDLYKQQTGMVPGAMASTLALNPQNSLGNFNLDYMGIGSSDDAFDFNTSPTGNLTSVDMDVEFDLTADDLFDEATVNPNAIGGQNMHGLPSPRLIAGQTSNVGRLWPGMHQQAALAKAQAQAQRQGNRQTKARQAPKSTIPRASDPIMEQKITQLLNSMRARAASGDDGGMPLLNVTRPRKDEDDMDEDERLLASEEGKKLTSKERRQLRNKVSARAFRSRRKEYISQLESEIASKVTENGDLRAQNRALMEENKRLSDLTRMLLSSPSFSDFLNNLSINPQQVPQAQPAPQPRSEEGMVPKDVNPYAAQQQMQQQQQQQVGVATIPEQHMDMSMLSIESDTYYQPQVYMVDTPESAVDLSILAGKRSNLIGEPVECEEEKMEMPMIERPAVAGAVQAATPPVAVLDEEFENDPAFSLYHDSPPAITTHEPWPVTESNAHSLSEPHLLDGIRSEKMTTARYELVDLAAEEQSAILAMVRIQRLDVNMEGVMQRLEALTVGL